MKPGKKNRRRYDLVLNHHPNLRQVSSCVAEFVGIQSTVDQLYCFVTKHQSLFLQYFSVPINKEIILRIAL